jgi:serine/threonine protein kinase
VAEKTASVPPPTVELELDGRYRIEAEIGAGGLGAVYRATHVRLDKPVAIKLLHARLGADEILRGRFEREAKALAALDHPNIVAVTDYGIAGNTPYLVMELLAGETLAQRLARGLLEPVAVSALALTLLRALAFVHRRGLVHRDMKPGNVFLQQSGDGTECLKLLDFGLAKFTAESTAGAHPTLTRSGDIMGTPAYMAPEQIAGDPVDARTDVYQAGVILFQMLAGRLPFEGEAADQLRGHLAAPPPRLSDARSDKCGSPALEAVLQRALAKSPKARFEDAGDLLAALEAVPQPWTLTRAETRAPTPIGDSRALAPTVGSRAPDPSHPEAQAQRSQRVDRRKPLSWAAGATRGLFLAGARLLAAIAFTVIVIALVTIYLARRRQVQPGDLKGLHDRLAPRIVELEDTAKRLARAASGQVGHAAGPSPSPKATSSPPDAATSEATSPAKRSRLRRETTHKSPKHSTR